MSPRTRFERDTAVEPLADGRFAGHCDDGWFVPRGPNGGYLAAIVLRAMQAQLAAPDRPPRSLTLHYLRPPGVGPVEVVVATERAGRRLSTLSARLEQEGRVCVLALGAFSGAFPAVAEYADPAPWQAPPPEAVPVAPVAPRTPSIGGRFELRPALGPEPFSGGEQALTGGWIRFADGPQALDAPALAMLGDAWLPAPFTRLEAPVGAPTIDLTLHFRAPEVAAAEPVLALFRSTVARGGFFEEDAELRAADGTLLAQARQLALLTP